ncbi:MULTISPECIES: ABC transporter substrate-binding protein [Arthrobacter]|uniref:ABC transporter substrate-binding protein n=1 Tax=Arthrobacter psychrochitiniphilus TaxID=291045 RepID=A0A2V3DZS3_9MICC|nr:MULTISPECIES: ABC transporter substrate-binding protein [Arthrobacter]NYG18754.1 raffinose/stachyose/melibiose transport system substrate-binding protein [Arthrobacter psychrochitiniphilus]PXA66321.1 ABC transporter substrate-binding protein [Arthrobacter psychrochitiniphilus]
MTQIKPWLKLATGALLATSVAFTASGCTTTDAVSSGDGEKSMTYWSMWTETEPQAEVLKTSLDAFQKDTGIKVNVQWQGRKVLDKVTAGLLSNDVPDLVDQAYDGLGPTLAKTNQLEDLAPVLKESVPGEDGKTVGDVIPAKYFDVLPTYGGDVKTYMVPYTISNVSVFYNKANKVAPDAPKTWDELLDNCKKALAADIACIASDGDATWANSYWFDYLMNRNAGDGSFAKLVEDKTGASFDDPAVLKTAKQIEELIKSGYIIKGYDASKYPEQQNAWASNKALYYLMGSWAPAETGKYAAEGFEYGAFNFPTTTATSSTANDSIAFGFAVPKKAKNTDAAKQFIAYFANKDRMGQISSVANNLSARPDVEAPATLKDVATILAENPTRLPNDGVSGDITDKGFNASFEKLFLGKLTAEQYVKEAKSAMVAYWNAKG